MSSEAQSLRDWRERALRETLCEGTGAGGVGEQEVVPRGAIQAHSRVEHLFRVRAAPSGDQDCPAKAIVLTLPPSPSQASLNQKSFFFFFLYTPTTLWASPPRN